jgi:hypothetical protein
MGHPSFPRSPKKACEGARSGTGKLAVSDSILILRYPYLLTTKWHEDRSMIARVSSVGVKNRMILFLLVVNFVLPFANIASDGEVKAWTILLP